MDDLASADGWQGALRSAAEQSGDFLQLGSRHWAFFTEARPLLLVTFETLASLKESEEGLPAHFALCKERDWSLMTLICDGETWWRDPLVFTYFDRISDNSFLEAFDRVVFYGAGIAGYAAAAFSVTAPGADVVLVAPRATGEFNRTGWDQRLRGARRINFDGRYSYAPDMIDSAEKVWLIHDPLHAPDAMHAALFQRPWVMTLHAPHTTEATEDTLAEMEALDRILEAVMEKRFSPEFYSLLWRGRRTNADYLRSILAHARMTGHPRREAKICRSVTSRLNSPRFARRLAELNGEGQ